MVQVRIITNLGPATDVVAPTTTPREVLEKNEIDYSRGAVSIDGVPLRVGDLDKSLAELGVGERCNLSVVVKADNA